MQLLILYFALFRRFAGDRTASIAPTFALLLIPILGTTGFAIDLSFMFAQRARMQTIVDSAAINYMKQVVTILKTGTSPSNVNYANYVAQINAVTYIQALINSDSSLAGLSVSHLGGNATYDQTTGTISAHADVDWQYKTTFMSILNISSVSVTNISYSSQTLPKYLSFYLMVDMSGSMGLPSTDSEQTRLAAVNPDKKSLYPSGCTFACHFSGSYGYTLSRNGGNNSNPQVTTCPTPGTSACIQLRTDAVGAAIQQLLATANATASMTNQYQIGLYPFIAYLWAYYPLTSNLTATGSSSLSYAAANITTLLDTGVNSNLGSGGTHFENVFPTMNSIITSVGDGSSQASPIPFVFLITDGSQDNQYQWAGNWWGSNLATTLDPANCAQLKSRGITISILYIPYQTIQNPTSYAGGEDFAANANIPYIPAALQSCASSGFFRTANSPTDIASALNAMFNQATSFVRITH